MNPGLRHAVSSALDRAGDVDARRRAELGEDVAQVRLDGLLAEEQLRRDLPVGLAGGDERRDLALAPRQRVEAAAARAGRPSRLRPRAELPQLPPRLGAVAVGT